MKDTQPESEKSTAPEPEGHAEEKTGPAGDQKMPGALPGEERDTTAPEESDEDFASARVSPFEEHPTAIETSSTNDSSDTVRPTMEDDNTPKENQAAAASDKRESYNPFAVATSDTTKKEDDVTPEDIKEEESSTKAPAASTEKNGEDNEDFDAVFMERPTDKSKQSSFSSGENESFEMISSNASLDKSKPTDEMEDEFDSAFASELHDAKMIDAPTTTTTTGAAAAATSSAFDDDFDSIFATQLMDAKVVHDQSNPFGPVPSSSTEIKDKGKEKMSWATSFGGFDFGQDDDDTKNNDEWDAIFGGGDHERKKDSGGDHQQGFQDTFADFGKEHNKVDDSQAKKEDQAPKEEQLSKQEDSPEIQERIDTPPQPQQHPAFAPTGSNLDQLLAMGFDRAVAKEALDRYDQDLEKATNFLLDQA